MDARPNAPRIRTPAGPARAVLFDVDGTLVDSERAHALAMVDVLTAHGHALPEGFDEQATGQPMQLLYEWLMAELGLALSYREFLDANHAAYRVRTAELAMRRGAAEAIDAVRRAGARMAVVSNAERIVLEGNLNAVGLNAIDLVSVSRNDVLRPKPDPEPYLRAAYLLEVEPAECVVVEDSVPGAMAGLAAGMRVVAWPEPHRLELAFPDGCLAGDPHDVSALLLELVSKG